MTSGAACKAVCVLMSDTGNNVLGQLTITQPDVNQPVKITGNLSGLTPGKHGLSVCVAGNLTQGAASCGPIFNPFGKSHGAPGDENRMVGDLGNLKVDADGNCVVNLTDTHVQLLGPHSVLGRSLVVYAGEDDQGRGGHENSLTTGNSGPRMGGGVIGLTV